MKISLYGYDWEVLFVDKDDKDLGKNIDGITLYNDMKILVRNDLNPIMQKECLTHELTHAVLCTQGRCYQKKFDLEEVCEFVGFCGALIVECADAIMKHKEKESSK